MTEKQLQMARAMGLTEADFEPVPSSVELLNAKLDALLEYQGLIVREVSNGVFEVVKEELPSGDYTNPIQIPSEGLTTEIGKWYYTTDKELPHEAIIEAFVMAEDFDDRRFFDFI